MVVIGVEIGQKLLFCKDSTLMLMILCFDNWCLPDIYYPGSTAIKIQCPLCSRLQNTYRATVVLSSQSTAKYTSLNQNCSQQSARILFI